MTRIKEINEGADYLQLLLREGHIDKKSFKNLRKKSKARQSGQDPSFEENKSHSQISKDIYRDDLPFKEVFEDMIESRMTATPWLLQDLDKDDLESISELESELILSDKMLLDESVIRASI